MKEKLYRLTTDEAYQVVCHSYIPEEDNGNYYRPNGVEVFYFTDKENAKKFYETYADNYIKPIRGGKYISSASVPHKVIKEQYIEVSEEEIKNMIEE